MGTWGANTFPVRKQLLNLHHQNTQTFVFLVFSNVFLELTLVATLLIFSLGGKRFGPSILAFLLPLRRVGCDCWQLYWGLLES